MFSNEGCTDISAADYLTAENGTFGKMPKVPFSGLNSSASCTFLLPATIQRGEKLRRWLSGSAECSYVFFFVFSQESEHSAPPSSTSCGEKAKHMRKSLFLFWKQWTMQLTHCIREKGPSLSNCPKQICRDRFVIFLLFFRAASAYLWLTKQTKISISHGQLAYKKMSAMAASKFPSW